MMKRFFVQLMALVLTCTLVACGGNGSSAGAASSKPVQESTPAQSETSAVDSASSAASEPQVDSASTQEQHVLVACFSATGNTQKIASSLQTILNADLYEIVPETPYTDEDLNYNNDDCRANQEQTDPSARPAITGELDDPEQYDVVFLGYPIWWGQAPKVLYTFLERYDFGDAVIVPFCTSGSSGIGSSAEGLQELTAQAQWLDGQRFSSGASQEEIAQWVESLALELQVPRR